MYIRFCQFLFSLLNMVLFYAICRVIHPHVVLRILSSDFVSQNGPQIVR